MLWPFSGKRNARFDGRLGYAGNPFMTQHDSQRCSVTVLAVSPRSPVEQLESLMYVHVLGFEIHEAEAIAPMTNYILADLVAFSSTPDPPAGV